MTIYEEESEITTKQNNYISHIFIHIKVINHETHPLNIVIHVASAINEVKLLRSKNINKQGIIPDQRTYI